MFPGKKSLSLGMIYIASQCILHTTRDCNRVFQEV